MLLLVMVAVVIGLVCILSVAKSGRRLRENTRRRSCPYCRGEVVGTVEYCPNCKAVLAGFDGRMAWFRWRQMSHAQRAEWGANPIVDRHGSPVPPPPLPPGLEPPVIDVPAAVVVEKKPKGGFWDPVGLG